MTQTPLLLIAGPTASGKSALALEHARRTGAVILNADSQQLYADLRVLTARPSLEDEALAEHRLYGVADAAEAWSVGRWSRAVLAEIQSLERQPAILVGGTGLYFTALTRGLADIPPAPDTARQEVEGEFDTEGEEVFRARLAQVDPSAAARIEAGDRQRLVRALTVHRASGRALSDWQADTRPLLKPDAWTGLVVEPDRAGLYARCDARAEAMLQQGALDEVAALAARGLDPALPAMKAVGVRELAEHLSGETTRAQTLEALAQSTRNYAKRQLTWFRNQTPDWPRA